LESRRYLISILLSLLLNFILFFSVSISLKTIPTIQKSARMNLSIVFEKLEKTSEKKKTGWHKPIESEKNEDEILKALMRFRPGFKKKKKETPTLKIPIGKIGTGFSSDRNVSWGIEMNSDGLIMKDFKISEKPMNSGGVVKSLIMDFKDLSKLNIPNFKEVEKSMREDYMIKLQSLPPERAKLLQGEVMVTLDIEKNGMIKNLEVLSSPDPALTDIAVRNIMKLKPSPRSKALKNVVVKIKFLLP